MTVTGRRLPYRVLSIILWTTLFPYGAGGLCPTKTTTVPSGNSGTSLVKFGIPTRFKASSSRAAWYRGSSESTRAFDFTSSIRPMGVDPTGVILFTVGFHPALRNIAANSAAKMRDSGSLSIDVTIKGPFRNPAVRATKFVSCCSVTVRHWIRACSSASSFSALAVFSCWTDNCVFYCLAAQPSHRRHLFCNPATLFSSICGLLFLSLEVYS